MLSGYRTRSILAAPMKNHLGRTIGVVQVLNKKRGEFTDDRRRSSSPRSPRRRRSASTTRASSCRSRRRTCSSSTPRSSSSTASATSSCSSTSRARWAGRRRSRSSSSPSSARRCASCEAARARWRCATRGRPGALPLHVRDEKHTKLASLHHEGRAGAHRLGDAPQRGARHERRRATTRGATPRSTRRSAVRLRRPRSPCRSKGRAAKPHGRHRALQQARSAAFTEEDRALLVLITANASTAIRLQLSREAREREERLTTIGRLLSGVIHDLKTPLTVISGYVQLMQQADEPRAARRVRRAHLAAVRPHRRRCSARCSSSRAARRASSSRKVYLQKFFERRARRQLEPELARRGVELVVDVQEQGTARFDEGKITARRPQPGAQRRRGDGRAGRQVHRSR